MTSVARVTGLSLKEVMNMAPAEFTAWQLHLNRYPLDEVGRLLALNIAMKLEPRPNDIDIRPWAYSPSEHDNNQKQKEQQKRNDEKKPYSKLQGLFDQRIK